jgi:hypothetical protein
MFRRHDRLERGLVVDFVDSIDQVVSVKPTIILCFSANGANRFAMLTWVDFDMAYASLSPS